MRTILSIFLLLLTTANALAQLTPDESETLRQAAIDADDGHPDRAVTAIEKIAHQHPDNYAVAYELGYAHMAAGSYKKAADTFHRIQSFKDADDKAWQMEGNALDYLGRHGDAARAYRRGLERFPRSGRLLMEMGNLSMADAQYDAALHQFLRGIDAEPSFPSNYFRAAWLLLQSNAAESGLAIAEAFMLLEPTGERAKTISQMLGDTYRAMARGGNSTTVRKVAETKKALLAMGRGECESDAVAYHVRQVEQAILDAGHWDAYCAWLTKESDTDGLKAWMSFHEQDMENFALWFGSDGDIIIRRVFGK